MFDFLKIYMASAYKGSLMDGGVPIKNLEVLRYISDGTKSSDKTQTATTDDNGNFSFAEVTGHSPSKFLPFEMRFHQKIIINYNGSEIKIFSTTKSNTKEGGEFGDMDANYDIIPVNLNFTCDIQNSDDILKAANGEYFGVCRIIK